MLRWVAPLVFYVFYTTENTQVARCINKARRPRIGVVRLKAGDIFGKEFLQPWFTLEYPRGGEELLCKWLGAIHVDGRVNYLPLPPILYRDGDRDSKYIFMNPALPRVRHSI